MADYTISPTNLVIPNFAANDSVLVTKDVSWNFGFSGAITSGAAIPVHIIFDGTITASRVIDVGAGSTVDVGTTGHVVSYNNAACAIAGSGAITNDGHIDGISSAYGIYIRNSLSNGLVSIVNNGGITSATGTAISIGTSGTLTSVTLMNSGNISGNTAYAGSDGLDQIINATTGVIKGAIATGVGDDALYNYGHIYGNIDMGSGNDTVYTHLSDVGPYTLTGGLGSDTLVNLDTSGVASVNLSALGFESYYGQAATDYVWAGASTLDTVFVGGAGNDAFVGGSGNDFVIGGVGADYLDGGAGFNSIGYGGSALGVTVNLFTGTGSGGDAAGDTFLNFQGVAGSDNADNIYGNNGVNYLSGAGGNDLIVGYGGNDILLGGAGNDIFYYTGTGYGHDEITDFTIGQDVIYVSTSIAANFAALNLIQVGANTLITTGADSIQLDNITLANLHASDFVFF